MLCWQELVGVYPAFLAGDNIYLCSGFVLCEMGHHSRISSCTAHRLCHPRQSYPVLSLCPMDTIFKSGTCSG